MGILIFSWFNADDQSSEKFQADLVEVDHSGTAANALGGEASVGVVDSVNGWPG